MPSEYKKQILSIITRNPPSRVVSNLVHSYRDPQGSLVLGAPVANRPWEWVEYLGEPNATDEIERERFETKHSIKNSGSISLETFGARLTGDSIVRNLVRSVDDPRVEDDLRSFEDGLASESVFARDWRETRVTVNVEPVTNHIQRMKIDGDHHHSAPRQFYPNPVKSDGKSTPKGSPAASIVSRSSGRDSSRKHQSPSQASGTGTYHRLSNSTMGETMDVDSMSTVASKKPSTSKRKTAVEDDDEVEIVEGPVPNEGPGTSKRPRTSQTGSKTTTAQKTRASLRKK
jgi:mediator of RNA polymerase II transcription subunit 12